MKKRLLLLIVATSLLKGDLQALSVGELVTREPRRLKVQRGWLPGVKVLDLTDMNIDSLKGLEDIPGIDSVTRLYLNNNAIHTIEPGDFAAAVNLTALSISGNDLETIEPNAFAGLKNLKVLNLSNNALKSIPQEGLNGMPSLRFLGMSKNPIINPKGALQTQVPKAFITTLPITKENIKKWGAVVGVGVAALIAAVAGIAEISRQQREKKEKRRVPEKAIEKEAKPSVPTISIGDQEYSESSIKAMSPAQRMEKEREERAQKWTKEETEEIGKFEEIYKERKKQTNEFFKYVIPELGLEEYLPYYGSDEPVTLEFMMSANEVMPTLSTLKSLGLTKEQVVALIQEWREAGHRFPDKRFDSWSVAKAVVKYAEEKELAYNVEFATTVEEPFTIGDQDYPESTIYAMTPEERGKLLLGVAKDVKDLDTLQRLIGWDADVNAQGQYGYTALRAAARNNNIEAISVLLDAPGIDVNAQDQYGDTALIWAARRNNTEAIAALLDAPGANVNAKTNYGRTALMVAALRNNIDAIQTLLAVPSINVNAQDNSGWTALLWAAYKNNTEAIGVLLTAGADVNAKEYNDVTALIMAVAYNNIDAIRALLAAPGIEVNAQDIGGDTALMIAETNGNTAIAELLRQRGAE